MDKALQRFLANTSRGDLSTAEVASILEVHVSTIHHLTKPQGGAPPQLGSRRVHGRTATAEERAKAKQQRGSRATITITRAALIRYLIRSSHGDVRSDLLADIRTHAPQWLEIAEQAAQAPTAVTGTERAANIIPFRRLKVVPPDPLKGHPDLFADQQSA